MYVTKPTYLQRKANLLLFFFFLLKAEGVRPLQCNNRTPLKYLCSAKHRSYIKPEHPFKPAQKYHSINVLFSCGGGKTLSTHSPDKTPAKEKLLRAIFKEMLPAAVVFIKRSKERNKKKGLSNSWENLQLLKTTYPFSSPKKSFIIASKAHSRTNLLLLLPS